MAKANDRARAAVLQANLMDNSPIEFKVGKKTYRVYRLGNWVSSKIDKLVAQSQMVQTEDNKDADKTLSTLAMNRTVVPKCISYMVLHHPIKVFLFHWIYWRYLNVFFNQVEYAEIMKNMYSGEEARFFFQNMTYLQMNNTLMIEMTRADMKSTAQKLASEASQMSSSPSMVK